jgi:hypothetical protein
MAVTAHVFPSFNLAALEKSANFTNLASSTHLSALLITTGTYTFTNAGFGTCASVTNFLAGDGTNGALTETSTSGTGYTRNTNIGSVTVADTGTGSSAVTTLSCANVSWTSATFTAKYALFYDSTSGSDTTNVPICYWDFGGAQSVSGATFTLTIAGTGLATWTIS